MLDMRCAAGIAGVVSRIVGSRASLRAMQATWHAAVARPRPATGGNVYEDELGKGREQRVGRSCCEGVAGGGAELD